MKKLVVGIVVIIFLLLASVMAIPLVFKAKIGEILLNKVNQSVNASINYNAYNLTLLKSFPDFTATFTDVSIIGVEGFKGDTLLYMARLSARIDMISLLKKESVIIKTIGIDQGLFNFIVNEEGKANWDIERPKAINVPSKPDAAAETKPENKVLKLLLQDIEIDDLDFIYTSRESNYVFSVLDVNAQMFGEMEGSTTILTISAEAPSISYNYSNTKYIDQGNISLSTKMQANFDTWEFTFQKGDTKLNNLPFVVDGGFSMPNDSILFNIHFDVPEINMNQVLELIPNEYRQSMEGIEASGMINFEGVIKGLYYGDIYPLIDINFNILNGKLKYPQLPDELTIHELNAKLSKPEGPFDALTVGIPMLNMQLADNPFIMHANFSSLFNDPHLDVAVKGKIDLETLSKVFPLGDLKMKGLMTADAAILGNYSALENNDFTTFISKGSVNLTQFYFQNNAVPQGIFIQHAALVLQNQDVQVNGLQGNIGRSDFSLKGQFNHLMTYLFANEVLEGRFELNSKLIDGNQFLTSSSHSASNNSSAEISRDSSKIEEVLFEFPKNIHLNFDAKIEHLLYDKMDISKFEGSIELKNQLLTLKGLSMHMLDGILKMDGTVLADGRPNPDVVFRLNVDGFDLPSAYRDISMVQKYLPIAAKSQGEFSTILNMKSNLTSDLKMILSSLTASGSFSTKNVKLDDPKILEGLKSVIQYEKLGNLTIDNFTTTFAISDGNLKLNPFTTKLAGQVMKLGGIYNLGGTLNFRLDATLDKAILAPEIQSMMAYIPGYQTLKKVDVGVDITGNAKKPDVKVDTDMIKKQVIDQLKNSSKEELQNAAKKLLKEFFK
ncbi:MAG: AsmA-like C-terminal region-containing protein [Prolixibacteraceae bacterium]